jgi:excinuclease UvrABC ATPase subunit
MEERRIEVRNARVNNLKNVDLDLPKGRLIAFTGLSGSGKSSLLFDTIYTEAQRQLVETFSAFARIYLPKLSRPDVDEIRHLSTAILIDQKKMGHNLRSTVGTATEVLSYLRLLFSRMGEPSIGPSFFYSFNHPEGMCPECNGLGQRIRVDAERLIKRGLSLREGALDHPEARVGSFLWRELLTIELFDPDKKLEDFSDEELRLLLWTEPVETRKEHGGSSYIKRWEGFARRLERLRAEKAAAEAGGEGEGTVYDRYFRYEECAACGGARINERARSSLVGGRNLAELCAMELSELLGFLRGVRGASAEQILRKAIIHLVTGHDNQPLEAEFGSA